MLNPGIYNLGDRAITAALTGEVITTGVSASGGAQEFIDRLEGMSSLLVTANFTWGSGGTSVAAIIQATLDSVQWFDVCRFDFTTASAAKTATILRSAAAAATMASFALAAEGVNAGRLGGKLRAVLTTIGTYAGNTSISIRADAA